MRRTQANRNCMSEFFLAACLLLSSRPADAEVINRVELLNAKLVIDHTKTIAEITRAQALGGRPASYGLGLFVNNIAYELNYGTSSSQPGIVSIVTRIKTSPTIYIAQEFPKTSCAYAVVLEHEYKHYLFDLDVLRAMPDQIRKISRDVFPDNGTTGVQEIERAKGLFFQRVKYVYDGLSFPLHVTIDNPASYKKLSGSCNGEISQRVRDLPAFR